MRNLNKNWRLKELTLDMDVDRAAFVSCMDEGWLDIPEIPCDITMALIAHGKLKDPVEGDNSLHTQWIENRSWWFSKCFTVEADTLKANVVELCLTSLDSEADILINGVWLGHHKSAFYPFIKDVKDYLRTGENHLLIRVTGGVDRYSRADIAACNHPEDLLQRDNRGDMRRVMVRKPQYSYGWDWAPRAAACGIMGDVKLTPRTGIAIRGVRAHVVRISPDAQVEIEVELENLDPLVTHRGQVFAKLQRNGIVATQAECTCMWLSGMNYINFVLTVDNPELWWPNGYGDQPLYDLDVYAEIGGISDRWPTIKLGMRILELQQPNLRGDEYLFAIAVNGQRIFCRGGNWVPADAIYCRVTRERYQILIDQASEANFTMLRVWGGGLYEPDVFYELCDKAGILVWQDFMMACALYPDHLEWFRQEVEKEAVYQIKRLRNHACLALWCGNNENHWHMGNMTTVLNSQRGGFYCYNVLLPRIIHTHSPDIPWWPSSPYGGPERNNEEIGDSHYWPECSLDERFTPEEFDKITSKFVSEYGYMGPCCVSSMKQYFGNSPIDPESAVWNMHMNAVEGGMVSFGIKKHYGESALKKIDDYILYGGLVQGLMYGYSLESFRNYPECWGALFWMLNDAWGEIGWSVIDYYLKRKPSYYFVKRALIPRKFILREKEGVMRLTGINETNREVSCDIEYGYISFDGKVRDVCSTTITLPAFGRGILHTFVRKPLWDMIDGTVYVKPIKDETILPAIFRGAVFKELRLTSPVLTVSDYKACPNGYTFKVTSDVYAHAVYFNLPDGSYVSDEYFDLLPEESRQVSVRGMIGPVIVEAISVLGP